MAAIKGKAVIWSVGAITYSAGIVVGNGSLFTQSVGFTRTSDKAEVKDNQGIIKSVIFSAFKKVLAITVVPAGGATNTIASAQATGDIATLQAGTLITVADDSGTLIDGSYNLISAKQNRTVDGVATIDLELEGSDEAQDITTLVS